MGKPFTLRDAPNAQRSAVRVMEPNPAKVLAHALDSDSDSLPRAAVEMASPDHEVGSAAQGDSDTPSFAPYLPWPAAEDYRGEPQTAPAPKHVPFRLK